LEAPQVFAVQLNDALAEPWADLRQEGRHARLLPGDGVIDLAAFLGALAKAGVQAPLAVEVLSDDLESHSPAQACRLAAVTTRRTLAAISQTRLPLETPA
jgi:sugar phosphate isomerase/epimerase